MRNAKFQIADPNASRPRGLRKRARPEKAESAKRMRSNPTEPEARLWLRLRGRRCDGFKFRRQAVVLGWIADFYCPELRLVVELDGGYHDTRVEEDRCRDEVMCAAGLSVLRIPNDMVLGDVDGAIGQIKVAIAHARRAV
jgi:very-short-patch-repair endonuclease